MRKFITTVAVGLASVAGVASAAAQTDDRDAVRRTLEAFVAFAQAKDLASIDTLWASGRGVHIIEGSGVNHGWPDHRDNHLGRELETFDDLQYRFFSIEPQVRGDVAWAAFQYELATDTPRGHMELEGRGTAILEKQEGRWVIVHLHTSGRRRNQ